MSKANSKKYEISKTFNINQFINALVNFLETKFKLEVQSISKDTHIVVQARDTNTLKNVVGMSTAITIKILVENGLMTIEQGSGKWIDRAAAVGVGLFVFWPALITAGIGAYNQQQLTTKIFEFIDLYITQAGGRVDNRYSYEIINSNTSNTIDEKDPPKIICPSCNQKIRNDSKFCPLCGKKIAQICKSCGVPVPIGYKFCQECGTEFVL
jgi:RNA polymerase subunit RPABC4/transcription elongation factor Spt4